MSTTARRRRTLTRKRTQSVKPIPVYKHTLRAFIRKHGYSNVTVGELLGRWNITGSESVSSFAFTQNNTVSPFKLPCYKHGSCRSFDGKIKFVCQVMLTGVRWKNNQRPYHLPNDLHNVGYHILVRNNGVLTFVPFNECTILNRLSLARIDSNGWVDFFRNIAHTAQHGCFCFAVVEKLEDGRLIIRRYNRWNDATPRVYWTAVKRA